MKRKLSFFAALSLTALSLASCSKAEVEETYNDTGFERVCVLKAPDLEADEFLAYSLHDASDFDMPVSEAIAFMKTVCGSGAATYSSDGDINVTSVRKLTRPTYSSDNASAGLYLMEMDNDGKNGYSICSADKRYYAVFAFVPQGSVSDTAENKALAGLISNMEAIVRDSIDRFNALAQARYESAVAKIEAKKEEARAEMSYRAIYGPGNIVPPDTSSTWDDPFDFSRCVFDHIDRSDVTTFEHLVSLKTKWHQGEPYNDLLRYANTGEASAINFKVFVGCVPVAIAQIMAHYKKGYDITSDMWNRITAAPNIDQLQDSEARTVVQQLMKYIYIGTNATSDANGTSMDQEYYEQFLRNRGFSFATPAPYDYDRASLDFNANRLLLVVGDDLNGGRPHAWIMNGCRKEIVPEKNVYYCEPKNGGKWYYKTHPNYTSKIYQYLNCEWGWGGRSDGWFYDNLLNPSVEDNKYAKYKIRGIYYEIK